MKVGTQSKPNMLIMNIALGINDLDPKLQIRVNMAPILKFTPIFMKCGTHNKSNMFIMNIIQYLERSHGYRLRMIIDSEYGTTIQTITVRIIVPCSELLMKIYSG